MAAAVHRVMAALVFPPAFQARLVFMQAVAVAGRMLRLVVLQRVLVVTEAVEMAQLLLSRHLQTELQELQIQAEAVVVALRQGRPEQAVRASLLFLMRALNVVQVVLLLHLAEIQSTPSQHQEHIQRNVWHNVLRAVAFCRSRWERLRPDGC